MMSQTNIAAWELGCERTGGTHEALDVYRKYAVLHMSLFPYRYAAAQESAKTGMPMMRALVLKYQDDPQARAAKDEYLFGPDFLVAPVMDENTRRPVYLPAGEWVDYWTGKRDAGGKMVRGGCAGGCDSGVGAGGRGDSEDSRGRDDAGAAERERQHGGEVAG